MGEDAKTIGRTSALDRGLTIVGCFTTEQRKARGTGISVLRFTGSSGWANVDHLGGMVNPSSLLVDPVGNVLYAAHGDADFASAYSLDPSSGRIASLGQAASGGQNGVSLALHPSRRFLFVANYSSGSITTLPIKADGSLGDVSQRLDLPGSTGPHKVEQTMSHPHDTVIDPSGRFLIVPDKGLDRIFVLSADESGKLSVVSHAAMRPGSGPRHVAFHPTLPRAYVVNEIDSTVASLDWKAAAGVLTPLHVVPALPSSFFGCNTAAEIVVDPSGRNVYASNRGMDSVTHFVLDDTGDHLTLVGWFPTRGGCPRFMTLSPTGDSLLVANELGDTIVDFEIDAADGGLRARRVLPTASPSAIAFL